MSLKRNTHQLQFKANSHYKNLFPKVAWKVIIFYVYHWCCTVQKTEFPGFFYTSTMNIFIAWESIEHTNMYFSIIWSLWSIHGSVSIEYYILWVAKYMTAWIQYGYWQITSEIVYLWSQPHMTPIPCVSPAGWELTMLSMISGSCVDAFVPVSSGIIGVWHHTWLKKLNLSVKSCNCFFIQKHRFFSQKGL